MKIKFAFLLVVLLLLTVGVTTALAMDPYANIKADFGSYRDPDAYGYVVINYVKGQDVWNYSGEVWNLNEDCGKPDERISPCIPLDTFYVKVGIAGNSVDQVVLTQFTVDENGYASFSGQVSEMMEEFNYIRVVPSGAHTIIGAGGARISYRGGNRVQAGNGE